MALVACLDVIEDNEWAGRCLMRNIQATGSDRLPVDGRNRPIIYTFVSLYPPDTKRAITDRVVDERCTLS